MLDELVMWIGFIFLLVLALYGLWKLWGKKA